MAAWRFGQEGNRKREKEAGSCGDVERKSPTEVGAEFAAEQISGGRTNGNRKIENAEDAAAFILWKQIGDKGGSDSNKSRLAYTDQRVPHQQLPIGVSEGGEKG